MSLMQEKLKETRREVQKKERITMQDTDKQKRGTNLLGGIINITNL